MLCIDVLALVDLCCEHNILKQYNGRILVYRSGGADCSEGWYLETREDICNELMSDEEGITFLRNELAERGIKFEERGHEMLNSIDALIGNFGDTVRFEEVAPNKYWAVL